MKTVISIIVVLGAIGLFFGYTNKKYQEIKAVKVEIVEYEEALDQSKAILAKRGELQKQYNSFKPADLKNLENLLPDHIDNVKLVLDMNTIAKRYGMSLKGIKIEDDKTTKTGTAPSSNARYGSIEISFKVTSTYNNFVKFLGDIEKSLRVVDVTALTFKATETGVYDYGVTLKTYWLNK